MNVNRPNYMINPGLSTKVRRIALISSNLHLTYNRAKKDKLTLF